MSGVGEIFAKVAPWLAAAAAGPAGLATMAIKTAANALGATEVTVQGIENAVVNASPEGLERIRLAEKKFQTRMAELNFKSITDLENIAAGDRKDARAMQIATRSVIPAVLSCGVTFGYFAILVGMMTGWFKVNDSQALLIMLGSLGTAWGMVMAFWFGTTRSSENKTSMLAQK